MSKWALVSCLQSTSHKCAEFFQFTSTSVTEKTERNLDKARSSFSSVLKVEIGNNITFISNVKATINLYRLSQKYGYTLLHI